MVIEVAESEADDLAAVVDAVGGRQDAAGREFGEIVEVIELALAVKEGVLVKTDLRDANDVAGIVYVYCLDEILRGEKPKIGEFAVEINVRAKAITDGETIDEYLATIIDGNGLPGEGIGARRQAEVDEASVFKQDGASHLGTWSLGGKSGPGGADDLAAIVDVEGVTAVILGERAEEAIGAVFGP